MPITGEVRVSDTSVRAFLSTEGGQVDVHMEEVAHRVAEYAREEAPRGKTGDLANSIVVRRNRGTTWTVAARKYYARYVIQGTAAHRIPREGVTGGKRLKFMDGNREVFARWVNHPKTEGNNFMQRALDRALRQ